MILTREKHRWLLRRVVAIISIAVLLLLMVYAFQNCGNPMDGMNLV